MIGMNAIREKREIQWNRSQIMVPTGSRLFFFYTCRVILRSEEYCNDEIPKCLIRKKCVVIWQLECRRHSCATIDLVCFVFCFCPQRLGIQGFYRQGFSLCYSSLIYVWGPTVVLDPISQGTN
jgi:hypothetical protein